MKPVDFCPARAVTPPTVISAERPTADRARSSDSDTRSIAHITIASCAGGQISGCWDSLLALGWQTIRLGLVIRGVGAGIQNFTDHTRQCFREERLLQERDARVGNTVVHDGFFR